MTINALLVEDDLDLAATIVDYLAFENLLCDHASNGVHGFNLAKENSYQVIILDINMPRMDGLTVCQKLRESGDDTPILMLTAKDTLADKVAGFNAGTDDYLVKPFEIEELLLRIQALSHRRSSQVKKLKFEQLELEPLTCTGTYQGNPIKLTPITSKLLEKLVRSTGQPVQREEMMLFIWGEETPDSNSLKVHLHHLRKQLELAGAALQIDNQPGIGLILRSKVGNQK